jgi:hypothetical protein
MSPRLAMLGASLNVLYLLAHLIDHRFQSEAVARDGGIVRFRAQCICLSVKFLR